jgi:hypothetical protein
MKINVRPSRERSRWVCERVLPSPVPPLVQRRVCPPSELINKGSADEIDCRVGDKIIDVDYIDIGLKRGYLQQFIGCGYINLSNPLLRKVIYFCIIDFLVTIQFLIRKLK